LVVPETHMTRKMSATHCCNDSFRLSRKQVRQDECDYPGYDVETQKYF
jgi:hypothetical protein